MKWMRLNLMRYVIKNSFEYKSMLWIVYRVRVPFVVQFFVSPDQYRVSDT